MNRSAGTRMRGRIYKPHGGWVDELIRREAAGPLNQVPALTPDDDDMTALNLPGLTRRHARAACRSIE
jgi:hypothetical protein